jgi:diguanylate cyclase (GGDEF)-like protein
MKRVRYFRSLPIVMLILWGLAMAYIAYLVMRMEIAQHESAYESEALQIVKDAQQKLDINEAIITSFAAFLGSVDDGDTVSTANFAEAAIRPFPHIYMLEVARKVPLVEEAALVRQMRRQWRPDFALKDFSELKQSQSTVKSAKDSSWPILFMHPALPSNKALYGVRLETVRHLDTALAIGHLKKLPVASPVFELYEGGKAYILLQTVDRAPQDKPRATPNFFGNNMVALMLVFTDSLFVQDGVADKLGMVATLAGVGTPSSTVWQHDTMPEGGWKQLLLPRFNRQYSLESRSQPIAISFTKQHYWPELWGTEMLLAASLLLCAFVLVPILTFKHFQNIERIGEAQRRSAYLATHDPLTGLPNRYLLADRFEQAFQNWQRNIHSFAVLLIDLDHFKEINDKLGHEVGDAVLVAVSQRLVDALRASDTVSRYGGDEFIVLLSAIATPEDARASAEKMLQAVSAPVETAQGMLSVSCSIGIALCPLHGTTLEILQRAADQAMYAVKSSGRSGVACAEPPVPASPG